jgi:hypothetical protein
LRICRPHDGLDLLALSASGRFGGCYAGTPSQMITIDECRYR